MIENSKQASKRQKLKGRSKNEINYLSRLWLRKV